MGCTPNKQYVVLVLVGSARSRSVHASLVEEIQHFTIEKDLHLKLLIPDLEKVPIFCTDIENQICTCLLIQFYPRRSNCSGKRQIWLMLYFLLPHK